jgi:hypothetical protein
VPAIAPKWTQAAVDAVIGRQVKAVGQLLVDSEHMDGGADCGHPDATSTCWRASVWELHPVTQFYVCRTTSCAVNSTDWVPLEDLAPSVPSLTGSSVGATGTARLLAKASDASRVTLAPATGGVATLDVATAARSHVADLKEGDTVQVTATAGPRPEIQSIATKSVAVSAMRRGTALALALIAILGLLSALHASPQRLVRGEDGRYSKSKFQVAVWFIALMTAYLATVGLRWWASGWAVVGGVGIPTDLLVISGISALTFVGAKSITTSKMAQSPAFAAAKRKIAPPHFPDDLVNDDAGNPDLGDAQMVVITLIAVVTYLVAVFSWMAALNLAAQVQMPNIDSTLVAVFGLGQGAYLLKKQMQP